MSKNRQSQQTQTKPAATPVTEPVATETQQPEATNVPTEESAKEFEADVNAIDTALATAERVEVVAAAPVKEVIEAVKPAAAPVATPPAPVSEFELPLSASPVARLTISELKEYIAKMSASTRMAPEVGGQVQAGLYHILIQAINTPAEEFEMVFGLVMKLIRANLGGCFSDTQVHRYTPHITLPSVHVMTLRYLVNSLTALADPAPAARAAAKRQINIEQALGARQIKEEARQRVLAFFHF